MGWWPASALAFCAHKPPRLSRAPSCPGVPVEPTGVHPDDLPQRWAWLPPAGWRPAAPGPPPPGGFQQQQHQPQHSHQAPSGLAGLPQNLPLLLALIVAVLGLVQYFLGFSDNADLGLGTTFLLAGGLLAAMHALPKGPRTLPFAALFSVLGTLEVLDTLVSLQNTPGLVIVVLILAILQMVGAVGALLIEHDVLKPPAPKPAAPSYGGQYGQPGGQQFNQGGPQGGPQYGQQQPGPAGSTGSPRRRSRSRASTARRTRRPPTRRRRPRRTPRCRASSSSSRRPTTRARRPGDSASRADADRVKHPL